MTAKITKKKLAAQITRAGTFRQEDASALEGKLRAFGPVQSYLRESPNGMLFIFPANLTGPQTTQAQAIVNAHVAVTDQTLLTPVQKTLVAYLKISGTPTAAQNVIALKALCKAVLRLTYRDNVDGIDVTQ